MHTLHKNNTPSLCILCTSMPQTIPLLKVNAFTHFYPKNIQV